MNMGNVITGVWTCVPRFFKPSLVMNTHENNDDNEVPNSAVPVCFWCSLLRPWSESYRREHSPFLHGWRISTRKTATWWPLLCNICWALFLREHEALRFFSDSSYGQSKNINVLSMPFTLWKQKFKDSKINYMFPTHGHTFFGRLEQEIKKKDSILLPSKYFYVQTWKCPCVPRTLAMLWLQSCSS